MRKKQKSITAHCAGRGLSLAAFCLALTLAILPVKGETVAASGQTSIQLETEGIAAAELPQPGEKLIPLGRTTGIKLFSKGTLLFSILYISPHPDPCVPVSLFVFI